MHFKLTYVKSILQLTLNILQLVFCNAYHHRRYNSPVSLGRRVHKNKNYKDIRVDRRLLHKIE